MIPAWRSSTPAYDHTPLPTPEEGALGLCTTSGCTHITEGADDPTQPMPAKLWPTARCMTSWLRDRERAAAADRPELVDEHSTTCNSHGPAVGADQVSEISWLGAPKVAEPQYTRRGDRAS